MKSFMVIILCCLCFGCNSNQTIENTQTENIQSKTVEFDAIYWCSPFYIGINIDDKENLGLSFFIIPNIPKYDILNMVCDVTNRAWYDYYKHESGLVICTIHFPNNGIYKIENNTFLFISQGPNKQKIIERCLNTDLLSSFRYNFSNNETGK